MNVNPTFRRAARAAERHSDALAGEYVSAIRAAARKAAGRFSARATLLAAANWQPPEVSDVMNFAVENDRIRNQQRTMLAAIAGSIATDIPGITFDALQAPTQRALDRLGLRAAAINDGYRETVARVISESWAKGRSVEQTATFIRTAIYDLAPWQAVMLARTDLIALSNATNNAAVGILNDAAKQSGEDKPIRSKTWLSAGDNRVRETHAEADGQTVPIDGFYSVGGYDLEYPGDPAGPDEEVINCRCTELYNEDMGDLTAGSSPGGAVLSDRGGSPMSATETEVGTRWFGDIAFEGLSTGDGRFMVPGSLGWRELPLTLMSMVETPEMGGHAGAAVAGRMDTFEKDDQADMDGDPLPEGVTAIRSTGVFDMEGERGSETQRLVDTQAMRGISVDLAVMEWAFRDPETGELIDPNEATAEQWDRAFMGEYEFAVTDGEIMAATVCPTPAFADARIAILASANVRPMVWRANALCASTLGVKEGQLMTTLYAPVKVQSPVEFKVSSVRITRLDNAGNSGAPFQVTASGGVSPRPAQARKALAPIAPPRAWFNVPEPDEPTPFTILDNGQVMFHLALWETCHTGYVNGQWSQCIRPPRSQTDYSQFHLGEFRTEEGDLIPIGKLTYDTGHADLSRSRQAARCHYDDTGSVGAFLRAKDGKHGIWVCGALKSDLSDEGLRDIRACPGSGDWRDYERNLELIAALAVPVPGFPISRSQLALAASAEGDVRVTALILTGMVATGGVAAPPNPIYEGAALAAVIEGGEEGLHALIEA